VNTRDEPHADPERYRRLHVISGDSTIAEPSTLVRVVSIEAVLRLIEGGYGRRLSAFAPLDTASAVRTVSRDPRGRVPYEVAGGGSTCALSVLSEVLALVDGADLAVPDPWWERGMASWRRTLGAIADRRLDDVSDEVDWVAKHRLLEAYGERHGLGLGDERLAQLALAYHELGGAVAETVGRRLVRLTTDDLVARAVTNPPPTRARLRGRLVAAAGANVRSYTVDWSSFTVKDLGGATVHLPDPTVATDPAVDLLIERIRREPRRTADAGAVP
jgi:proteasome accessory factor A